MNHNILIKTAYRALNKNGQSKPIESIRVADLHPNVKYNDYFISSIFGIHLNGQVKILKSGDERVLKANQVYSMDELIQLLSDKAAHQNRSAPFDIHFQL